MSSLANFNQSSESETHTIPTTSATTTASNTQFVNGMVGDHSPRLPVVGKLREEIADGVTAAAQVNLIKPLLTRPSMFVRPTS